MGNFTDYLDRLAKDALKDYSFDYIMQNTPRAEEKNAPTFKINIDKCI